MSRISTCFDTLKQNAHTAFIPYIMAGDPKPDATVTLMHSLADNGADIIEIGFPFSDPTADGPTIQQAALRALQYHITLQQVLDMCKTFRQNNDSTPLVLMGYANPVMQYGYEAFSSALREAGVDGLIIVDLPPEEEAELLEPLKGSEVDFIRLLAPTTIGERLPLLLKHAGGFVYNISIKGITGTESANVDELQARISDIAKHTDLPIVTGFGIKTPDDAKAFKEYSDGVVVGSALVEHIHKAHLSGENIYDAAAAFTKAMSDTLHQ